MSSVFKLEVLLVSQLKLAIVPIKRWTYVYCLANSYPERVRVSDSLNLGRDTTEKRYPPPFSKYVLIFLLLTEGLVCPTPFYTLVFSFKPVVAV